MALTIEEALVTRVLDGHYPWGILVNDVRVGLSQLPDGCINTLITSPPYWGLRSYGTNPQMWGGDINCRHNLVALPVVMATGGTGGKSKKQLTNAGSQSANEYWREVHPAGHRGADSVGNGTSTLHGGNEHYAALKGSPWQLVHPAGHRDSDTKPGAIQSVGTLGREKLVSFECRECGAYYGEFGAEPTPERYIANLVLIFRDVWRVLHDTGVVWLNLGASYAAGAGGTGNFKPKDMVPIPWMAGLALQQDGWYLRSDIIWAKGNPMPESVLDRPTRSHEYILMLTKSAKYYYDSQAIAEPAKDWSGAAATFSRPASKRGRPMVPGNTATHRADRTDTLAGNPTRNKRDVWTVNTRGYKGAHFAVYPESLIEPCVLAATSAHGHCPACGAGWERVMVAKSASANAPRDYQGVPVDQANRTMPQEPRKLGAMGTPERREVGWRPTCKHYDSLYHQLPRARSARHRHQQDMANRWWKRARKRPGDPIWSVVPGVVLDPFIGSGTTAVVALRHGRVALGIELNPDYANLARDRIAKDQPLFNMTARNRDGRD